MSPVAAARIPGHDAPMSKRSSRKAPRSTPRPAASASVEPGARSPRADRWLPAVAWLVTALFAAVLLVLVFVPAHVGDYATDGAFYDSHQQGAWLIQHGRLALDRYRGTGPGYDLALALAGFVSG